MLSQFKITIFYLNIFENFIYCCDQSWIFSITPVFSVTWSFKIILIYWFVAQETFLIIINVEKSLIFLWDPWFFSGFFDE